MVRKTAMDEKREARREQLWPGSEREIFNPTNPLTVGYARIPRVLALVGTYIEHVSTRSSASMYLGLWCQEYGQGLVEVTDPEMLAFESGIARSTARAMRNWREAVRALIELGFIKTAARGPREHAFVLLRDPHLVIAERLVANELSAPRGWLEAYEARCRDIGVDLTVYANGVARPRDR